MLKAADGRDRRPRAVRWSLPYLIYQAVLMAWDSSEALRDRFDNARQALVEMFPHHRRPGATYQGYVKALRRIPLKVMVRLDAYLRRCHQRIAGEHWLRWDWAILACDGSRVEVPRTQANQDALRCAGRKKTGPQLALTVLYHMGTGLPWTWRIGPGTDAERVHLRSMLSTLPGKSRLVADAGFTGYDLLRAIVSQKTSFLIRVGANVMLLKNLGWEVTADKDVVWLWPEAKRDQPPLKLRLVRLKRASASSGQMCLLTNVFDRERLSDQRAATIYEMRWGVEVFFRSFKQTMQRRKMRSASPDLATLELHWGLIGLLLLTLMSLKPLIAGHHDPLQLSVAMALRVVRQSMRNSGPWRRRGDLGVLLAGAVKDTYKRRGSKTARDWPHKKYERPPGVPKIRDATKAEKQKAEKQKAEKQKAERTYSSHEAA